MKILHVVQAYHPAIGGSEWLVKNISERLVHQYGDDVTVFTPAVTKPIYFWKNEGEVLPPGTETINGVTVKRFKVFAGLKLPRMLLAHTFHRLKLPFHDWARTIQTGPIIPGLSQAIANSGADIIFATAFPFMHMYYALAGAKRGKIPLVYLGAIHTNDQWGYNRRMMYNAIKQVEAYIAHTSFEREHLTAQGVNPEKIQIIGGGVDINNDLSIDGAEIRQRYKLDRHPVLIFLGRQSSLKRLDILLAAMPIVWRNFQDTRLLIAGAQTNYSIQLKQLIRQLPLHQQNNIIFIHDFSEQEKPKILAAADIFVHPGGNESFGIAFIEAWSAGKPVIGADTGAIKSLITDHKTGLLFEYNNVDSLANKILLLLKNQSLQHQLGKAGQIETKQNYTWDIVTARIRNTYESLIYG